MWLFIFIVIAIVGLIVWLVERSKGGNSVFALICFIASIIGVFTQLLPGDPALNPTYTEGPIVTAPPDVSNPTPMPTMFDRSDNISEVPISDQSDAGFDTGLGTNHFHIANSASDNFGNSYTNVGYFSWQDNYASDGYVIFYVADYSKVTGQIVAIEGERPADNAVVVFYDDDGEVTRYSGIEKTTLPIDFSINLSGKNFFKIYTNSQEIMYVNFEFIR